MSRLMLIIEYLNYFSRLFPSLLSMLSEQHDALSIYTWLKRWLKCGTRAPKEVVSDQSHALMSALVQAFTEYNSLEKYLNVCFSLAVGRENENLPSSFIRYDVNHFIHLVTQWKPLKLSKYPRTKQLFCRAVRMLIFCKTMSEAEKILEAMSKFDGPLLCASSNVEYCGIKTLNAISKHFLQNFITPNVVELVEIEQEAVSENSTIDDKQEQKMNEDYEDTTSFKNWARKISIICEKLVEGVIGDYDNAQYVPELVPIIVNSMKLFP